MEEVYERLRKHLDELPIGMPKTDSNIELELLRELFTLEEAQMALNMKGLPESIEEISQRIGKDPKYISNIITGMVKKGLIFWGGDGKERTYRLMSFYPGILELQYKRLEKETARKIGKYLNTALTRELVGTAETQLFRVVPINKEVPHDLYVFPYDSVATIIENSDFICMTKCFCRTNKNAAGEGCGAPTDTCLVFGDYAKMFVESNLGESISRRRAMDILEQCEEQGLIHCTFNTEKDNLVICNCCGCCCSILRGVTRLHIPTAIVKSDYMLEVDQKKCTGCETCVDRCHMNAALVEEYAKIDRNRCVGCGVCILTCPTEARSLVRKSAHERVKPLQDPNIALERLVKERKKTALSGAE